MAKKIFGAFYVVDIKQSLDFEKIQAVSIDLRNCGKAELSVIYTDREVDQGFFLGGHAEHHNEPAIIIFNSTGGVNITVEQPDARAEGLIRVTLALPRNKKLSGFRSEGNVVEYNLLNVDIDHVNIANKKGKINFRGRVNNLGLYSRYYPVDAQVELTQRALLQLGSRTADVMLTLVNAKEICIKRKPEDAEQCLVKPLLKEDGYAVDVYLDPQAEGQYTIK